MKYGWDIILLSFVSSAYVLAADVAPPLKVDVLNETKGVIYEMGSKRKKKLFDLRITEEQHPGELIVLKTAYLYPDGKPASEEEIYVKDGKVWRYLKHEHQIGVEGEAEVRDGKVHYKHGRPGEQTKQVETLTDDLVFGPLVVKRLKKDWEKILKGGEARMKLGVLEQKESFGFRFVRTKEHQPKGRPGLSDAVVVRMEPTNFFVRQFVDPMFIVFSPDGEKVHELIGRSVPKIQDAKGEWKALDAETVFE